jgi:hypothetical protein
VLATVRPAGVLTSSRTASGEKPAMQRLTFAPTTGRQIR